MPTETKTPVRIQRKRIKGWRKPANTVIVDRTSRWGNPFVGYHAAWAFEAWLQNPSWTTSHIVNHLRQFRDVPEAGIALHKNADTDATGESILERLPELRGKNLA